MTNTQVTTARLVCGEVLVRQASAGTLTLHAGTCEVTTAPSDRICLCRAVHKQCLKKQQKGCYCTFRYTLYTPAYPLKAYLLLQPWPC